MVAFTAEAINNFQSTGQFPERDLALDLHTYSLITMVDADQNILTVIAKPRLAFCPRIILHRPQILRIEAIYFLAIDARRVVRSGGTECIAVVE